MKKHLIKTKRNPLIAFLGVATSLLMATGCLTMQKDAWSVSAAETTAGTVYCEPFEMKQVSNGASGKDEKYYYNYNPTGDAFNDSFAYLQNQSDSAIRMFPNADFDSAIVWTAPEDGSFYITNSKDENVIRVTTNLQLKDTGTTKVAMAKGVVGEDGKLALNTLIDIYSSDLFLKIEAINEKNGAVVVTDADIEINGNAEAPISIKKGESFLVIAKAPNYAGTDYRGVQIGKFYVNFTSTAGAQSKYTIDGNCVGVYTRDSGGNITAAAPGKAAEMKTSFYAIKSGSYKTTAVEETDGETGVSKTLFDGKAVSLTELTCPDKDGMWYNKAASSNYCIAIKGSVCKMAPSGGDRAIAWKVPEDGELNIDKLYVENSYVSNNYTLGSDAANTMAEKANGVNITFAYVDNSGSKPVYYDLIPSGSPRLVGPSNTEEELTSKSLNLTNRKLSVKAGDDILLIINNNTSTSYDASILDWQMTLNGQMYIMNKTTPMTNDQGVNGFYFYGVDYRMGLLDLSTAYKFGKIQETETYFEHNARGNGNSCFWNGESDNYIQPSTSRNDGHPTYLQMHPQRGKNVAFVYTADADCEAVFKKIWIQKQTVKDKTADGFRFAFIYKSVNGEEATYYSLREEVWETVTPSSTTVIYRILEDELPVVSMKAGDSLMLVYDNNQTTTYDTCNSYVNVTCYYPDGKEETHNMCDEIKISEDNSEVLEMGHWSIRLLQMAADYSDVILDEAADLSEALDFTYTAENLEWDRINNKYISYIDGDISISKEEGEIEMMPGLENATAMIYTAKEKGRILVDDDSFIKFLNDGFSNGIRFRIMKNDTVIYPISGGWKNYLDENTFYLKNMPVVDVEANDQILFVIDSLGNTLSDTTRVDFVVHFAKDGEEYTNTSKLSSGFVDPQSEEETNWSYASIAFDEETSINIFTVNKNEVSVGGCAATMGTGSIFAITTAMSAAMLIRKGGRKNDEE